jgi:hypothetical protein
LAEQSFGLEGRILEHQIVAEQEQELRTGVREHRTEIQGPHIEEQELRIEVQELHIEVQELHIEVHYLVDCTSSREVTSPNLVVQTVLHLDFLQVVHTYLCFVQVDCRSLTC